MPFVDLTPPPTPPQRNDDPDTFAERADAFVVWMAQFGEDLDAFIAQLETAAALIAAAPAYADPGLVALAGNTPAADRLPYYTGVGTSALATFTAAARALLDDTDAAAMRTTLGLSSLATSGTVNDSNWSGTDLAVVNGGTGASTASAARGNLGAAASGANSDITSLSALSTALSVAQGGTGVTSLASLLAALITVTSNANGICFALPIGATTYKLQWGRVSATANSSGTITFPSAYTTASSVSVVKGGSNYGGAGDQDNYADINGAPSTTGVGWGNPDDTTATLMWIAIGY